MEDRSFRTSSVQTKLTHPMCVYGVTLDLLSSHQPERNTSRQKGRGKIHHKMATKTINNMVPVLLWSQLSWSTPWGSAGAFQFILSVRKSHSTNSWLQCCMESRKDVLMSIQTTHIQTTNQSTSPHHPLRGKNNKKASGAFPHKVHKEPEAFADKAGLSNPSSIFVAGEAKMHIPVLPTSRESCWIDYSSHSFFPRQISPSSTPQQLWLWKEGNRGSMLRSGHSDRIEFTEHLTQTFLHPSPNPWTRQKIDTNLILTA